MTILESRLAALEREVAPKPKPNGQALLIRMWEQLLHEQPDFRAMVQKRRLEQPERE